MLTEDQHKSSMCHFSLRQPSPGCRLWRESLRRFKRSWCTFFSSNKQTLKYFLIFKIFISSFLLVTELTIWSRRRESTRASRNYSFVLNPISSKDYRSENSSLFWLISRPEDNRATYLENSGLKTVQTFQKYLPDSQQSALTSASIIISKPFSYLLKRRESPPQRIFGNFQKKK